MTSAKPPLARYASPRPAAIFGQSKPHGGSSIFGEDIISDKSLDEVIMSYLAEDLDASAARAGDRKPRKPEGPANAKATGTPEPGDAGSAATRRK